MFNIKFEANMLHYDLGQQLIGEINYCQKKNISNQRISHFFLIAVEI